MDNARQSASKNKLTRRGFLRTSATASAGLLAAGMGMPRAFAAGSDTLKVGLIGCGGRGTGAAKDCLNSSPGVQIVALADAFKDRVDGCRRELTKQGKGKADIPAARCFVGLDAYKELIATGVDMVILATPPGFRPIHLAAAVAAGKHVFMEKPVAVDPIGVRSVIESGAVAGEKKLGIVAGTQRRHQKVYVETMKRILDGAIGQVVSAQCYWNQHLLWVNDRREGQNDVEWQLRNWLYFTWLSGDHIVEQHVHNLDVINWAFGGPPTRAYAMGGRAARKGERHGNIYDHFCVEFWYPNGARTISMCRQTAKASTRIGEHVAGTKGISNCAGVITDLKGKEIWKYKGDHPNPYVQEHADLIASIRSGKPLNEAQQIAESTMTAIMGRMSAYTGRELQWSWAMKASKLDLVPKDLKFGPLPVRPVSKPGATRLT
ncbi:Inositol 2-dehydrogenase/D-chiro-inositol 3-dehydrogenase [subsurface metagenome]